MLNFSSKNCNCRMAGIKTNEICIIFFYDFHCSKCREAKEKMEALKKKYPLYVKEYDSFEKWDLLEKYYAAYNVSVRNYGLFAIFIGDKYYHKLDEFDELEKEIKKYVKTGLPCPDLSGNKNMETKRTLKGISIIAVILGGLVDGINPCAFATLVFFIAYLERVKYGKKALLSIGIAFSIAIFIGYLLISLGILEFYYQMEKSALISKYIYIFAAILALSLAVINILDFIRIRKREKPFLQLPMFLKRKRGRIIKILTEERGIVILTALAFIAGFIIAMLEFVCTGQVLFPIIAVIKSASPERMMAFAYLILYNIMFILPLLAILTLFYIGYHSETFGKFLKERHGIMKILLAAILAFIGIYMLYYVMG